MKTKFKHIFLLGFLTALTFSNILWNGFVGDDHGLVVENSFYHSWENFPRLFDSSYSSVSDVVLTGIQHDLGSGSVAYRPVLSATFFLDYGMWQKNPFGFHLTNLVIHVINCLLVYLILLRILPNASVSLLAALIFAVHPLKTEAVAAIGYRADILSTLFVLLAFRLYMSVSASGNILRWTGVYAGFVLALFSKESAAVFPFLCLAYDHFIKKESWKTLLRHGRRYIGFFVILAAYVYLYISVFTNEAVVFQYLGGSLFHHALVMIEIFSGYLIAAFIPLTVGSMPPVYHPPLNLYHGLAPIVSVMALLIFAVWCVYIFRKSGILAFFIVWFVLGFLPVSNIIPLPNPMAYRFMYLPSVGLSVMFAYLIERICSLPRARSLKRTGALIKGGIIGCMMMYTFLLNFAWRNDYTMAAHMARDFPHSGQGEMFLGMYYCQALQIDQARDHLRKAYETGVDDPRLFYNMAFCRKSGMEEAKRFYQISIRRFPGYLMSYIGLGRIYLFENQYDKALELLEIVLDKGGTYSAYGYTIQAYMLKGEMDQARAVLGKAKQTLTEKGSIRSLGKMLKSDPAVFPVDIGI